MKRLLGLLLACSIPPLSAAAAGADVARVDSAAYSYRIVGNKAAVSYYERTTILAPAGEEYGQVQTYESRYVKLKSIDIKLLDAAGKVMAEKGKSDMVKACGFGQGLYDDNCRYILEPTAPAYPYTVEVSVEQEYQSLFYITDRDLQQSIPVRRCVVALSFDDDHPSAWRLVGADVKPVEKNDGGRHQYTWVLSDLPGLPDFKYSPPGSADGIRLRMAAERFELDGYVFGGRTWKNVGLWQHELNRSRIGDSLGPAPANDSVAKAIIRQKYNDVISTVRYVFVSIGISGWQPEFPDVVARKNYGDCKGMTGLLVSRLRAAGIRAYPCLILTNDEGTIDTSFVAKEFNHVITMAVVGQDTIWMDPTCDVCPMDDLPVNDEHNTLLVVTDTGGVLVTTPLSRPKENIITHVSDVTIDELGHITLATTASVTGNRAHMLRGALNHAGADDTKRYVGEWFIGNNKKYTTTRVTTANLGNLNEPVKLEAEFSSAGTLDRIRNTGYFIPFLLTSRSYADDANLKERKVAVNFGTPWTIIDSVYIHGPILGGCDSVRVPDSVNLSFGPLRAVAHYSSDSSGLRACLTQIAEGGEVPVEKFDSLAQFLTSRKQLLDKPIKFYLKAK